MILPKLKVESWNWGIELYTSLIKFWNCLKIMLKISEWTFIMDIVNHAIIWNEIWEKRFVNDMDGMRLGMKRWNGDLRVHIDLRWITYSGVELNHVE